MNRIGFTPNRTATPAFGCKDCEAAKINADKLNQAKGMFIPKTTMEKLVDLTIINGVERKLEAEPHLKEFIDEVHKGIAKAFNENLISELKKLKK